jgi:hypothetical protein
MPDNRLRVCVDDTEALCAHVRTSLSQLRVSVSAWNDTGCTWQQQDDRTCKERLFQVKNKKSWAEYYSHYTQEAYPHSIIVKCDDDIVYIDPAGFYRFIHQVTSNMGPHLFAFPNIVNNGVCAHYMQKNDLLPSQLFGILPHDTYQGRLWNDGPLCQRIHEHFVQHRSDIQEQALDLSAVRLTRGSRISINFFAVRSEDLGRTFNMCGYDDEHDLTVRLTDHNQRSHLLVQSCIVAHLSFYRQRETGLDEQACLQLYHKLADDVLPDPN